METISKNKPLISILLVEDEKITLELLATILAKKFPDVSLHTAINGRVGLELFKEHTQDIVITDFNLPGLNGLQMVGKIRQIKADTKIIVITADTGKTTLEHSVGKGFKIDHFILKPVGFGLFFTAIQQCLDEITQQTCAAGDT